MFGSNLKITVPADYLTTNGLTNLIPLFKMANEILQNFAAFHMLC